MIKLEVGKTYIDLQGRTRTVVGKCNGYFLVTCSSKMNSHMLPSVYDVNGKNKHSLDYSKNIVAEYEEPAKYTADAWVVWYKSEFSGTITCSLTRVEPHKYHTINYGEILHIHKVTYTEGE